LFILINTYNLQIKPYLPALKRKLRDSIDYLIKIKISILLSSLLFGLFQQDCAFC
jgi:hypothetical protein